MLVVPTVRLLDTFEKNDDDEFVWDDVYRVFPSRCIVLVCGEKKPEAGDCDVCKCFYVGFSCCVVGDLLEHSHSVEGWCA